MQAYLGMVMYFGGTYAPRNFAMCLGQLLPVSQNAALFSLMGTYFGGNGQTTFALPSLGGRAGVGTGTLPGAGSNYNIGQLAGSEQTTLLTSQMPMHVHGMQLPFNLQACTGVGAGDQTSAPSAGQCLGSILDSDGKSSPVIYAPAGTGTPVNLAGGTVSGTTGVAGGSQPISIMQPYLALTALICVQGIFPSRN